MRCWGRIVLTNTSAGAVASRAGRDFVRLGRKDDPTETLLANSLSGFDAIDAASQTDIDQHDCWTMS